MKWTLTKISDLPLQTRLVGSLMFFGLCAGPTASTWAADFIFTGGHIYTADATAPSIVASLQQPEKLSLTTVAWT